MDQVWGSSIKEPNWTATQIAYRKLCKQHFPPIGEQQVEALERQINVDFPDTYREYLVRFNGGYFTEPTIPSTDWGRPADCLTFMAGIGASHPSAELGTRRSLAIFDDNDPPLLVPIGYTIVGYLILLVTDPSGDDYGEVVLRSFSESFVLASNIAEFFELLVDE